MKLLVEIAMVVLLGVLALVGVAIATYVFYAVRNRVQYVVLPAPTIAMLVSKLGVRGRETVYDLGCGDGRVIGALMKDNPNAVYVGVENNPVIWALAKLRLRSKARVVLGEIMAAKLHDAKRVFVYLGPKLMSQLEPKFELELQRGARVVSIQYPLPGRAPHEVVEVPGSPSHAGRLYVYDY